MGDIQEKTKFLFGFLCYSSYEENGKTRDLFTFLTLIKYTSLSISRIRTIYSQATKELRDRLGEQGPVPQRS